MKVSIAQINPSLGDFQGNTEKIRQVIHRAISEDSRILILPYGAISGFPQGNLAASEDFRAALESSMQELAIETLGTSLAVFIEGQEVLHEGKISSEGFTMENADSKHLPLPSIFNQKNYDIFVNIGPKIFEKNRCEAHEMELTILARDKKAWVFDVNLCGATDEIIYTGLSSVISPEGEIFTRLAFVEEDFITVDLENTDHSYPVAEIPAGEEILKHAIVKAVKDYTHKNNFEKVLVSVSGGIDSALVLALAVEALGAGNVKAVYLPSKFSSDLSRDEAYKLCENLGVEIQTIAIEDFHDKFLNELAFLPDAGSWHENIQARIRGCIVMSISNANNYLVLTTGNKSEVAMGYFTLYGDACGGLAPICDLLKTEVRALCRYINTDSEIIPSKIITRAPSAELKDNQADEDSLPNYDFLDQVLFLHCEEGLDCAQISDRLGRQEDVLKIFTLLYRNSYKRKQLPQGIKVSKRFFGLDWHIPATVYPWFTKDFL